MKRIVLFIMAVVLIGTSVSAQPAKRRTTTSNAVAQKGATSSTASSKASNSHRATLQFPAASSMPDDVVWKRDIYRQLDLLNDKNAPMYYPVEPNGRQMNLFTYLFRLILTGRVTAYAYKLDGNESFEEKDKMSVKDMLERYNIYYEEKDGKIWLKTNLYDLISEKKIPANAFECKLMKTEDIPPAFEPEQILPQLH